MVCLNKTVGTMLISLLTVILFVSVPGFADMQSDQPSFNVLHNLTFYTESLPPYNYEEDGEPKGLSVDLLQATANKMGYSIPSDQIHVIPWETAYETALSQNNSVVFSTVRTPEREEEFKWVGPISIERDVLFAHPEDNLSIHTPEDLKGLTIGVTPGHAGTELLLSAGVKKEQIITESDVSVLIRKLESREIDLLCYPELTGRYHTKQVTGNYYAFVVVYPLDEVGIYYAFNRDIPESTIRDFQNALDSLKMETDDRGVSSYERILDRYIPGAGLSHLTYLTEEWAPYNYERDGLPAGIAVDILEKVFDILHANRTRADVQIVPLSEGFSRMQNENETVLFSIVKTPEREPFYQWAGPFTTGRFVLFAPADRNITISSAEDLDTYTVGAIEGTIENTFLSDIGVDPARITGGLVPDDLIGMLEDGSIDIWATGDSTGRYAMKKAGIDPARYEIVYTLHTDDFYFIFTHDVPESLIQTFNQTLGKVLNQKDESGVTTYEKIMSENLGYVDEIP